MGTKIYVERVAHTHHCLCPVHGDGPGLAGLWVRPVQYGLETRARMASIWSCPVPTYFAYQAMWPCTRGAFIRCLYLVPLFGAFIWCLCGGCVRGRRGRDSGRAPLSLAGRGRPQARSPASGPRLHPPGLPPVARKLHHLKVISAASPHCPKYC